MTAPAPASLWQSFALAMEERRPNYAVGPWFTLSAVLTLDAPLDATRLAAAFTTLQQRHDVLRTELAPVPGGGGVQLVCGTPASELELVDEAELHVPVSTAAPIRLRLAKDTLTLHLHHLIADPMSLWLVFTELAALYSGTELPPAVQYADYARDEAEQVRRNAGPAGDWWRTHITDAAVCAQPAGSGEQPFAYRGELLDAAETAQVDQLTRSHRSTPLVTLLTALAAAMDPFLGEGDMLVFNTLFSKRDRPAWQQVLGPCIIPSMLAVPRSTGSLAADLPAARTTVVGCSRYARFPVADVPVPGRTPLFEYVPHRWPAGYDFGSTRARVTGAAGPKDVGLAKALVIRVRPTNEGTLASHLSGDGTDWTEPLARKLTTDLRSHLLTTA